jgi:hypothetical protein
LRALLLEIVADNLKKAGWTSGCISSTDRNGRQFWVVAAERSDAGRFIVHADQELPAFLELESAIQTDRHNHKCDCPEPDKNWEIIADNLSKAGWSWGCVSALNCNGRTIWIADAHRDDGRRFVVRADQKLTALRPW